jgi:putative NADH-flavin reductase
MKLFVLGATGGTGTQIVRQALDAGHDITALAREPSRIGTQHPRLTVVAGDTTGDSTAWIAAMRNHDAVISAIGRGKTFKSDNLIKRSVPAILEAMHAAGLRRLIFTSALGVGDTFKDSPLLPKIFFKTLLRDIYADKLVGDDLIRRSGLDWTIVQPAVLTDGPLTCRYRSAEHLALVGMPAISRADTAHFILASVNDQTTFGKTLILAT